MPVSPAPRAVVAFREVDIVFGDDPKSALPLIDAGRSREEIVAETGQIVGVKNASLDIGEGEIVVLMGLSGSGKSTLLRAVNALNPIARGQVTVFDGESDVDVHACSRRRLRALRRRRVAMVFQHFGLLPWRSVNDNVALGLELDGVGRAEREERVASQLEIVGLDGWGEKRVQELSGGMQQRVGLARAFVNDAPILLMDEPFSALDPLIRVHLQDELLALQKKLGRTIVFVSHDLDEALKIGSRIAIMEGGEIVQVGTPQDIVLAPSSDYVRDFVAHMNPLNVLRAQEVMRPLDDPEAKAGLGDGMRFVQGRAVDAQGTPGPTVDIAALASAPDGAVVTVAPQTPLRALIDARMSYSGPFVVLEEGAGIGVIGDHELFACLRGGRDNGRNVAGNGAIPASAH